MLQRTNATTNTFYRLNQGATTTTNATTNILHRLNQGATTNTNATTNAEDIIGRRSTCMHMTFRAFPLRL